MYTVAEFDFVDMRECVGCAALQYRAGCVIVVCGIGAAGWNEGINNRYQNSASFCWVKLLVQNKRMDESDFSSLGVGGGKDNRRENCKKI
jgi:hypothetical protein